MIRIKKNKKQTKDFQKVQNTNSIIKPKAKAGEPVFTFLTMFISVDFSSLFKSLFKKKPDK